jgi:hypothetical protein
MRVTWNPSSEGFSLPRLPLMPRLLFTFDPQGRAMDTATVELRSTTSRSLVYARCPPNSSTKDAVNWRLSCRSLGGITWYEQGMSRA